MSGEQKTAGATGLAPKDTEVRRTGRFTALRSLVRRRPLAAGVVVLGLAACASAGVAVAGGLGDLPLAAAPTPPATFGFGSAASAARIAQWDVNAFPDGKGLPAGAGTVAEGQQVF